MSGTLPTSPDYAKVELTDNANTLVDRAHSGRRFTRDFGGQFWIIDVSYINLSRDEFEPINSLLLSQFGATGNFLIQVPHKNTPRGVATGTPLVVNGASESSGNTLVVDGFTVSTTNIIKRGDVLTIAGDTKVYEATADANSDGGGEATLTIYPALIADPANNAVVTFTNVQYTVFKEDVIKYPIRSGFRYDLDLRLFEHYA